jgi:hypothetical protein
MTAQMIRRFQMRGLIVEDAFVQIHDNQTHARVIITMMKDEGYVPLLDVNPVFLTSYIGGDKFEFSYTMQGVYVGRDKAWQSEGMLDGKLIPSTPRNR